MHGGFRRGTCYDPHDGWAFAPGDGGLALAGAADRDPGPDVRIRDRRGRGGPVVGKPRAPGRRGPHARRRGGPRPGPLRDLDRRASPDSRENLRLLPRRDPGRPRQRHRAPGHRRRDSRRDLPAPADAARDPGGPDARRGIGRARGEPRLRPAAPRRRGGEPERPRRLPGRARDALSSLGVVIAAVVVIVTGWTLADPLASGAIALVIVPRTWRLLRQAVNVLLEGTPAHLNLTEIEDAMISVPGVRRVHDLHVWTLTSGREAMSAHAVVDDVRDSERLLETLHAVMHARFGIDHTTLQLETEHPAVL